MTDLEMWSLLVGFAMPNIVAIIQQPKWHDAARSIVTFLSCVIAGFTTAYLEGAVTTQRTVSSILYILITALSTYKMFWKPIGIAPALERATSSGPSRP